MGVTSDNNDGSDGTDSDQLQIMEPVPDVATLGDVDVTPMIRASFRQKLIP